MARPESFPKTPLAHRIRQIRRDAGDIDRAVFAQKLHLNKNTIAFYERGERTPDANVLAAYRQEFAVDLNWLITGEKLSPQSVLINESNTLVDIPQKAVWLLSLLGKEVTMGFDAARYPASFSEFIALFSFALDLIVLKVDDPSDKEEIEAALPQIRLHIKRRLKSLLPLENG